MGVSRSATVALAALLAGSVAHATLVHAQAGPTDLPVTEAGAGGTRVPDEPAPHAAGIGQDAPRAAGAEDNATAAADPETVGATDPAGPAAGLPADAAPADEASKPAAEPARSGAVEADPAKPDADGSEPATAELPAPDAPTAQAPTVQAPASEAAPVAEAPAPVPADPLAAAVAARLSAAIPLLPRLTTREREAIQAFYALGAFRPVWIVDGRFTPAARAVAARLGRAGEDGLDPAAYPVPVLGVLSRPDSEAEIAEADVKLSAAAALYARDARGGRINLAGLSRLITPALDLPPPETVLGPLAAAGAEAGDLLQRYNPQEGGYQALKARLAALRERRPASAPAAVGGDEALLLVNMERWRWLPRELGRDYVMVNIPEFRLRVLRGGSVRDETRVIVGKPESPTPLFSGLMEYAVVNPSWNVPPSILKNEFLPGLARDPNYAARRGYQVVRHGNTISVRQPPGERNALGFIKFMFPNNHAVYLHDTPNRTLFASARRALSHGCVRVDDPFRFADSVLPDAWSSERLKGLIGKGERTIRLTEKLPVHLAYFTAYIDDHGAYRTLPDLYGYDARMRAALGLPGGAPAVAHAPSEPKRKVAEMPRAQKPVAVHRQARRTVRAAGVGPAEFGEPGLWTPRPPSASRGWW
ncbi:L,D-transpeptidase family protein [Methylobacterium nigriterrae]|uniref:L,D-transpeptidase family protein n=1 Tax=Methylobacterium nigriterrae TaxID=3127512 RepID=UPI003013404D